MTDFYHDVVRLDLNEGLHTYRIHFPELSTHIKGPINFSIIKPELYINSQIITIGETPSSSYIDFHLYSDIAHSQVLFDLGFWY